MITKKIQEQEVKGVARVKLTVEKFDENDVSMGTNVFENTIGIGLFKSSEQPENEGMLRTEGIITGTIGELRMLAELLVDELRARSLLRPEMPSSFGGLLDELLNLNMGPEIGDEDEDEDDNIKVSVKKHDCARCAIRDFCDLDWAVEYRASEEYDEEDGNEGLN